MATTNPTSDTFTGSVSFGSASTSGPTIDFGSTSPDDFARGFGSGSGTTASSHFSWGVDPYMSQQELTIDINYNDGYKMRKIKSVLEKVYTNHELRKSIVPLFIGDPGLGKTVIIQEFARKKGVALVELITSQMSPFEISGIAMPDKDIKKMVYYNFDKLENLKDGDILFFDELLNGNPVVLNACLTILEQRKFISGKDLPNIMIIAAANPQAMAPLTPQIKERFVWYTVNFDQDMWVEYMLNKYSMPTVISNKLCVLIKNEEFRANNFFTPRSIDKAVNMIIHGVETPYEDTITPLLEHLIQNPLGVEIDLPEGRKLAPEEMISWLELIKLKFKQ